MSTKKAQIIIAILTGITVISLVITTNLLTRNWLDSVRQDAYIAATNRIVGNIVASIEQNDEVAITIPDGNGGSKKLTLVTKKDPDRSGSRDRFEYNNPDAKFGIEPDQKLEITDE